MWLFGTVVVGDRERAIILNHRRLHRIYGPGRHWFWAGFGSGIEVDIVKVTTPEYTGEWANVIAQRNQIGDDKQLKVVKTSDTEVAPVFFNGNLDRIIGPGKRVLFWCSPVTVTAEPIDISTRVEVPAELVSAVARLGRKAPVLHVLVREGTRGLLYIDGRWAGYVDAGAHAFWTAIHTVQVDIIDVRRQILDIAEQLFTTRDNHTIRIGMMVEFSVDKPATAARALKDWENHLYQVAQPVARECFGSRSLNEILTGTGSIATAIRTEIHRQVGNAGIAVMEVKFREVSVPEVVIF